MRRFSLTAKECRPLGGHAVLYALEVLGLHALLKGGGHGGSNLVQRFVALLLHAPHVTHGVYSSPHPARRGLKRPTRPVDEHVAPQVERRHVLGQAWRGEHGSFTHTHPRLEGTLPHGGEHGAQARSQIGAVAIDQSPQATHVAILSAGVPRHVIAR